MTPLILSDLPTNQAMTCELDFRRSTRVGLASGNAILLDEQTVLLQWSAEPGPRIDRVDLAHLFRVFPEVLPEEWHTEPDFKPSVTSMGRIIGRVDLGIPDDGIDWG